MLSRASISKLLQPHHNPPPLKFESVVISKSDGARFTKIFQMIFYAVHIVFSRFIQLSKMFSTRPQLCILLCTLYENYPFLMIFANIRPKLSPIYWIFLSVLALHYNLGLLLFLSFGFPFPSVFSSSLLCFWSCSFKGMLFDRRVNISGSIVLFLAERVGNASFNVKSYLLMLPVNYECYCSRNGSLPAGMEGRMKMF